MLFLAQFKLRATDDRGRQFVVCIANSDSNTMIRLVEADYKENVRGILEREYEGREVFCLEVSGVMR